jgi:hypothetical protein
MFTVKRKLYTVLFSRTGVCELISLGKFYTILRSHPLCRNRTTNLLIGILTVIRHFDTLKEDQYGELIQQSQGESLCPFLVRLTFRLLVS